MRRVAVQVYTDSRGEPRGGSSTEHCLAICDTFDVCISGCSSERGLAWPHLPRCLPGVLSKGPHRRDRGCLRFELSPHLLSFSGSRRPSFHPLATRSY